MTTVHGQGPVFANLHDVSRPYPDEITSGMTENVSAIVMNVVEMMSIAVTEIRTEIQSRMTLGDGEMMERGKKEWLQDGSVMLIGNTGFATGCLMTHGSLRMTDIQIVVGRPSKNAMGDLNEVLLVNVDQGLRFKR